MTLESGFFADINQAEIFLTLFFLTWWAGTVYDGIAHKSWLRAAPCFPLAGLTIYYALLVFEVGGFRSNIELRGIYFRWMLNLLAISETVILASPLFPILWALIISFRARLRLRRSRR